MIPELWEPSLKETKSKQNYHSDSQDDHLVIKGSEVKGDDQK